MELVYTRGLSPRAFTDCRFESCHRHQFYLVLVIRYMSSEGFEFDKSLLILYPEYTSVLGPYYRQDGRKHIILNNGNKPKGAPGKTKTISYPKALMEVHLGRRLLDSETVDHRDGDFTNDGLSNLQILTRGKNASKDHIRVRYMDIKCAYCGRMFTPTKNQARFPERRHFCSRKCKGLYDTMSANLQLDEEPQEITREYYLPDDDST